MARQRLHAVRDHTKDAFRDLKSLFKHSASKKEADDAVIALRNSLDEWRNERIDIAIYGYNKDHLKLLMSLILDADDEEIFKHLKKIKTRGMSPIKSLSRQSPEKKTVTETAESVVPKEADKNDFCVSSYQFPENSKATLWDVYVPETVTKTERALHLETFCLSHPIQLAVVLLDDISTTADDWSASITGSLAEDIKVLYVKVVGENRIEGNEVRQENPDSPHSLESGIVCLSGEKSSTAADIASNETDDAKELEKSYSQHEPGDVTPTDCCFGKEEHIVPVTELNTRTDDNLLLPQPGEGDDIIQCHSSDEVRSASHRDISEVFTEHPNSPVTESGAVKDQDTAANHTGTISYGSQSVEERTSTNLSDGHTWSASSQDPNNEQGFSSLTDKDTIEIKPSSSCELALSKPVLAPDIENKGELPQSSSHHGKCVGDNNECLVIENPLLISEDVTNADPERPLTMQFFSADETSSQSNNDMTIINRDSTLDQKSSNKEPLQDLERTTSLQSENITESSHSSIISIGEEPSHDSNPLEKESDRATGNGEDSATTDEFAHTSNITDDVNRDAWSGGNDGDRETPAKCGDVEPISDIRHDTGAKPVCDETKESTPPDTVSPKMIIFDVDEALAKGGRIEKALRIQHVDAYFGGIGKKLKGHFKGGKAKMKRVANRIPIGGKSTDRKFIEEVDDVEIRNLSSATFYTKSIQEALFGIVTKLEKKKCEAFVYTIHGSYYEDILESKADWMLKRSKNIAALSAVGGAVPVPGVSAVLDVSLLLKEIIFFRKQFGLDEVALKRFRRSSGVNPKALEEILKDCACLALDKKTLLELGKRFAVQTAVEEISRLIPVVGSIVAGGISFYTSLKILELLINDMKEASCKIGALLECLTSKKEFEMKQDVGGKSDMLGSNKSS
ncbi:uncharacterized protein LOC106151975 [Lingula anatina]|uniref:Uncharacterized protein LOC106151975 n=1 Tax=Lingula anatina TaxID=7574 RepID=A0A1S3H6Y1_LINAN|nr:uncharacterized protein LOC106151975 [Lingula anatina]|eukprot:XP_013380884.1 uncharacterized protein LOC106151975 [Lingula anatina]